MRDYLITRNQINPFVYKKEFPTIPYKIPNPSEGFSSLREEINSYFPFLTLIGDPKYSPWFILFTLLPIISTQKRLHYKKV